MIAGGLGVLLVIILIMLIFGGEEGGKADERLSALQAKVDQIEKTLAGLAGFEDRMAQAEKQARLAQQSMAGAERQLLALAIARSLRAHTDLAKILRALGRAGIQTAVLKGPSVAAWYPDPSLRPFGKASYSRMSASAIRAQRTGRCGTSTSP